MTLLTIGLLIFVPMLVEAARARRNERAQKARGGLEPPDDVYAIMRIAYPAAFLAMLAEGAAHGRSPAGIVVTVAPRRYSRRARTGSVAPSADTRSASRPGRTAGMSTRTLTDEIYHGTLPAEGALASSKTWPSPRIEI